MAYVQPFDLFTILVNWLFGDITLFSFGAVIAIAAGSAYFRMPDQIFLVLIVLFTVFMAQWIGGMYLIAVLLTGLIVFHGISRVVQR